VGLPTARIDPVREKPFVLLPRSVRERLSDPARARRPRARLQKGASMEGPFFRAKRAGGTRKEKEMGEGYGTLRLWSTVLVVVGVAGVIFVVIGTIFAVFSAPTVWQGVAFLLIGGPLAVLFASWPIALGQGLRALADVAEHVQRQRSKVT